MLGLKVQDNSDFGAEIIRTVREHDGLSRVELARELGVAASTIGRHVDALVTGRYFTESLEPTREAGRPPTKLRPNPNRGSFIGVDFYADRLFASVVDFAQKLILRKSFELEGARGVDHVLEHVAAAIQEMASSTRLPVLAVGIATPGRVDKTRGVAIGYDFVPGFNNVPMVDQMSKITSAPVFLENNIRTMALAERWFGEARGSRDVLCLGVRLNVTAGIIRDGHLSSGHQELAGEVRSWNCPRYDSTESKWTWQPDYTFDQFGTVTALLSRYATLSGHSVDLDAFITAAEHGHDHALAALKETAYSHGWAIAQMLQLVDPQVVVLSGPLTKLGELYRDNVAEATRQFTSPLRPAETPIRVSELGEYAGAVGATALALERWRPADLT